MDEIINEAQQIIDDAAKAIDTEAGKELTERLLTLEQSMWDDMGASHLYEIYILALEASSREEVEQVLADKDGKDVIRIGAEHQHEANGLLSMKQIMNSKDLGDEAGSLLDALAQPDAAMYYSTYPNMVGYAFRTEATATEIQDPETGELRDTTGAERQDVTVTGMLTPTHFVTCVRNHVTGTVVASDPLEIKDYKGNGGRVLDALFAFTFGPQMIKREQPEIYEAMMKDVMSRFGDSDTAK